MKRGEKPSVIAQIKKYQEQQEKYEKKKREQKIIIGIQKGKMF